MKRYAKQRAQLKAAIAALRAEQQELNNTPDLQPTDRRRIELLQEAIAGLEDAEEAMSILDAVIEDPEFDDAKGGAQ